jgi:fibronectin-binding autotransporter adhesin
MANRYWVGGTASWDGTAGTKWATTSGGAGGQAEPTAADDVFFDAASGAVTVTVAAVVFCQNLTTTGFTGTFAGGSNIRINGSLTLNAGVTFTYTGTFQFTATSGSFTITTAGKTVGGVSLAPLALSTATWTLGDALTTSGQITVNYGTFTTNNFNVTATSLSSSNSNTRTINLGSSTVTLSTSSSIACATSTGLTFNAGTSTIVINSASGGTINFGNNTTAGAALYNLSGTYTAGTTSYTLTGVTTANNISVAAPAVAGVSFFEFASPCTINGTLSTTGTAGNRRVWFKGITYGLAQTLTINSAPSLTDADFRDIYVIGTAAPISGTRVGNRGFCRGITFSTPKTAYWNTVAGGNWSDNAWAATSGGGVSTDNFPLAQDTAVIENTGLNTSATVTMDAAIGYAGTVTMSTRTNAMTLSVGNSQIIYGNWVNGSGTTISGNGVRSFTFMGNGTQSITSAGKSFGSPIDVNSYGGSVELADALDTGGTALSVTNGTFDTKNYNVTASALSSSNSNVRTITLGSSTLSLSLSGTAVNFQTSTNLTFNAGTSLLNFSGSSLSLSCGGQTFNNVSLNNTTASVCAITGANTFNNLTITATASAGLMTLSIFANQTITGTLTCAGATAVRRIFLQSSALGTARTLTVGTLSATDCDFRDITMAGAAAGSSPTRAGDCGGNTSITFPAAKTVYWNLAGAQNWSATGWCPSSGGTPDINQFPLAQDTAVFDNTGSVTGTIAIDAAWNIGTFNASARSIAMTLAVNTGPIVYGNVTLSSAVTISGLSGWTFSGRGTTTITSAGVVFPGPFTVSCVTGTVQLADAVTVLNLNLNTGAFDAVTYNVTITGAFSAAGANATATLKMGSGTWTLSGTGTVWNLSSTPAFYKGTANIVLSSTSTSARTFTGGSLSYNKLTIGGTTGTSTTTISGVNLFTELASTKTVAHTIDIPIGMTLGAWTVTGTVGNVVTVTGTPTLIIAGARVSGVDYLALGTTAISTTSPGEFYAGANSTGTGTGVILTAAPAAVTRYWRGGTGTWDATTTTNWSTTSGGVSGASVPTSADAVIFDTLSNATAYTVTCTATQLRCAALTFAGPATGNVTWTGNAPLAIHGNFTLPATGITCSYSGNITLTGSSTGRTLTTNGVTLASTLTINGVGCEWTLGSALSSSGNYEIIVTNGSISTSNYNITNYGLISNNSNSRTITLGSSTISSGALGAYLTFTNSLNLTFNANTSTISSSSTSPAFNGGGNTFYNVTFTDTGGSGTITINGVNTFNNLSFAGMTTAGIKNASIGANQTINGTLTLSAGTDATMRTFVRSDTIGTTRTLTCAAFSGTDADFRDITIAGAAAPVSGTRLGDCKGNSGITFGAGVTRYWNLAGGGNWSATGWAATSGGAPAVNNFPLAQDTALFEATGLTSGNTITINANYNIGTINMSARTSNTMTLATGSTTPTIYGNWVNGTGTTLTGTGAMTFAGRGSQTITSAGRTFTQNFTVDTPSGSVTLQDAFASNAASASGAIQFSSGTFSDAGYNLSLTSTSAGAGINIGGTSNLKTLTVNGSCSIAASSGCFSTAGATVGSITVTGTGTISLTSASAKTFAGGGISYSGITLNQGGAGTLTITGNNTFANISNTYKATGATNITLGTTTQTVGSFTASGEVGRVLTVQGTSASSPGTLILSSGTVTTPDYLAITGVRAYNLSSTWFAGANSTNNGSLGWIFSAGASGSGGKFFLLFG